MDALGVQGRAVAVGLAHEPFALHSFNDLILKSETDRIIRLRDVAQKVGITERATQLIVADLVDCSAARATELLDAAESFAAQADDMQAMITLSIQHFALLVEWDSAEAHEAAKASEGFQKFVGIASPWFGGEGGGGRSGLVDRPRHHRTTDASTQRLSPDLSY